MTHARPGRARITRRHRLLPLPLLRAAEREPAGPVERAAGATLLTFGLLLVLVEAGWQPLLDADAAARDDAHRWALASDGLTDLAQVVSALGSTPVLVAVVVVLAGWLRSRARPAAAVFVVVTAALASALNLGMKALVGRQRPELAEPVAVANGLSFPSGHAMNSTTVYALVLSALLFTGLVDARRWWPAAAALVALPVLIGASRVVLGVHYVSDVLAGWALAVGWVLVATSVARPWRRDVTEPGDEGAARTRMTDSGPSSRLRSPGRPVLARGPAADHDRQRSRTRSGPGRYPSTGS